MKYKIQEIPAMKGEIDPDRPLEAYNYDDIKTKKVNIRELCNQFIHSYHFRPAGERGFMIGFFINSDWQKTKGLYFITTFEVINIYRAIGNSR